LSKIDYQKNALDCKGQCVSPISQLQGMPALKRSSNSVGNTHSSSHDETASSSCCPGEGPRVGELMSCAEEVALRGPLRNDSGRLAWEALARKRWQPVSRRRVLSKGWHLDVGPGEFIAHMRAFVIRSQLKISAAEDVQSVLLFPCECMATSFPNHDYRESLRHLGGFSYFYPFAI